ncbi:hypothetical protein [Streptomyces rugosispiralis]|uniref:Uncharacterized protein n=1 Tax=Streptomyces rugosispiralis TaxID=2967341 RepID=A0ABT1VB44_9ACTN|nr:hypothetical protein [Streptomyces rugosispiralis]MCQ8194497.1 hypothetical protein [Streptomyces rugosispiralis]
MLVDAGVLTVPEKTVEEEKAHAKGAGRAVTGAEPLGPARATA